MSVVPRNSDMDGKDNTIQHKGESEELSSRHKCSVQFEKNDQL